MRKVIFSGANSLDNCIARPDHAFDWILHSDEAQAVLAYYWKTIDMILWGRKTYEVALRHTKGKVVLARYGGSWRGILTALAGFLRMMPCSVASLSTITSVRIPARIAARSISSRGARCTASVSSSSLIVSSWKMPIRPR